MSWSLRLSLVFGLEFLVNMLKFEFLLCFSCYFCLESLDLCLFYFPNPFFSLLLFHCCAFCWIVLEFALLHQPNKTTHFLFIRSTLCMPLLGPSSANLGPSSRVWTAAGGFLVFWEEFWNWIWAYLQRGLPRQWGPHPVVVLLREAIPQGYQACRSNFHQKSNWVKCAARLSATCCCSCQLPKPAFKFLPS